MDVGAGDAGQDLGVVDLGVVDATLPSPSSFDDLYRAEWGGLVALGWSLTGSWTAAEELAQDAFADAYRRWGEVSGFDRPGAWVRRAVVNRAASHHRSRDVQARGLRRISARAEAEADRAGTDRTGDRAADQVGDPAFWAAVRSLPDRQVACVALHYLEDRSVADIADVLGLSAATVKVHLHRGRLNLAKRLAALADTSPPGTDPSPEAGTTTDRTITDRTIPDRTIPDRTTTAPIGEEDR